jgi:hypothetical protein
VLAQTHRDFELIVIDDGSTDGTGAAISALGDSIRYQWQPNTGVAAARNAGIRLARGSLVAFIDSDNRWLPDHLAVLTDVLRRHPEAVLASTCRGYATVGTQAAEDAEVVDALPDLLLNNDVGYVSGTAARRDALLAAGGFDDRLSVAEDSELWLRLAMRGPIAFVRRRTVVRQTTLGGLEQRGGRLGAYLDAWEIGWPRIISELERLERDDRAELIAKAEGNHHMVKAIRALDRHDAAGVRGHLDRACRLVPELSSHGPGMPRRLGRYLPRWDEPSERLRVYRTAAGLWPDQRADTALYLRACGALLALRRGHVSAAASLLRGWPIRATPGFVARITPGLVRNWSRTISDYRNRGHESPLLAASSDRA